MPSSPKPSTSRRQAESSGGRDDQQLVVASPVEALLRSLLSDGGREDAAARIVDGTRSLLEASWVALYDSDDGAWICRRSSGTGPATGEPLAEPPKRATRLRPLRVRPSNGAVLALWLDITTDVASLLLIGPRVDGGEYDGPALQLLAHVAADLELVLRKADDLDRLREQAFLDALTGCYNRRGFDEHLQVELTRAKRYDRPLALMLVDLDAFKRINDKLGHQSGDHVIRRFAELLTNTFRTTDIISRYGGDEFAVIFPETTLEEAARLAERIRLLLHGLFPDPQISRGVTASFGVAAFPADAALSEDLVASADRALYAAKTAGRDRVVAAKKPRKESR